MIIALIGMILLFVALNFYGNYVLTGVVEEKSAWWVTAGSLFPPTAPIFMPMRAALTTVPAWQMVTAVLLMAAAIAVLIRVGGRLYRGAAPHTAGRTRLRQAWRGTIA